MNLEQEIRAAIIGICKEKIRKRIEPANATFLEVFRCVKAPANEVKQCINRMIMDGQLEWGKTINDNYFRIVK